MGKRCVRKEGVLTTLGIASYCLTVLFQLILCLILGSNIVRGGGGHYNIDRVQ